MASYRETHNPPARKTPINWILFSNFNCSLHSIGMGKQHVATSVIALNTATVVNIVLNLIHFASLILISQAARTGVHWNMARNISIHAYRIITVPRA